MTKEERAKKEYYFASLCRVRNITLRDKEGYYILIKDSILQKYMNTFNVYMPNNRASRNMRQKNDDRIARRNE